MTLTVNGQLANTITYSIPARSSQKLQTSGIGTTVQSGSVRVIPTGGAMPLVWAHAEYLKLVRSLMDGRVFDMPDAAYRRYVRDKVTGLYAIWSTGSRIRSMLYGRVLRIQTDASVLVHWSTDNWRTREDTASRAIPGLGIRLSDLDTSALPPRAEVVFTLYYPDAQRWEGRDYRVVIEA